MTDRTRAQKHWLVDLLRDFRVWTVDVRDYAEATRDKYAYWVERADGWLREFQSVPVTQAGHGDLRAWISTLPRTPSTRNQAIGALKAFYAFRIDTTAMVHPPTERIDLLPRRAGLPKPLEEDELERVLTIAEAEGPMLHAMFVTLAYTGLRKTELLEMQWDDIEETRWLRFTAKGAQPRIMWLHPKVLDVLDGWRPRCPSLLWCWPSDYYRDRDTHVSSSWLHDRTKEIGDLADVPDLHPHQLRHTFATRLVDAGVDLRVIQDLMGHKSPESTMIYTKVRDHKIAEAVERLS